MTQARKSSLPTWRIRVKYKTVSAGVQILLLSAPRGDKRASRSDDLYADKQLCAHYENIFPRLKEKTVRFHSHGCYRSMFSACREIQDQGCLVLALMSSQSSLCGWCLKTIWLWRHLVVRVNDRQKCKSDTRDQKAFYEIKQIWGTDVTSDPLLYVLCVHPNDTIYAKLIYIRVLPS